LLDTNILLRYALATDPQHRAVRTALRRLVRADLELCIGAQSLFEFWVVATRPTDVNGLGLEPALVHEEITLLINAFTLLPDPPDLFTRWLELCDRHMVKGRTAYDTPLVALMAGNGVSHLLTFNADDFQRYPKITVIAPGEVTRFIRGAKERS
jgi:predicted nucleic acid-binding protein